MSHLHLYKNKPIRQHARNNHIEVEILMNETFCLKKVKEKQIFSCLTRIFVHASNIPFACTHGTQNISPPFYCVLMK